MENNSNPAQRPHGFAGIEPEVIDHKNPPKPIKADDMDPTPEAKPDHFTRIPPEVIDPHAKKKSPGAANIAALLLLVLLLLNGGPRARAQFTGGAPGAINPNTAFSNNVPGLNTNTPGGFTTNPPAQLPSTGSIYAGTNANPNGLYYGGYGSIYHQFDATGTNFVQAWIKYSASGNTNWFIKTSPSPLAPMADLYRIRTTSVLAPLTDLDWDEGEYVVFNSSSAANSKLATYRWDNGFYACGENGTQSASYSGFNFYTPPGTTNVQFSGWFECQTNVTMNEAFVWCNPSGIASFTPTITNNWTYVTNNLVLNAAVSGGTNLVIVMKRDQSNAGTYGWNVSNLMVTLLPTPTNLPNPFYRYAITPDVIQYSSGVVWGYSNAVPAATFSSYGASSGSYIDFQTTETNLVLEWDTKYDGETTEPRTVVVNGTQTYSFTAGSSSPWIQVTNLALPPGVNRVRLFSEGATSGSLGPWRAIYTSTNSVLVFDRPKANFKIAVIGDSTQIGFQATNQYANEWGTVAQVTGAQIYNMSSGGSAYFHLGGMGLFSIEQQLAALQPNIIWDNLGYNDNYHSYWAGTNQFTAGVSNVLVSFHNACPGALIVVQSPTYSATAGTTNYVVAIGVAVSTSPVVKFCLWVNAFNWLTALDLNNDPHPNDYGNAKYAYNIVQTILTLNVAPF